MASVTGLAQEAGKGHETIKMKYRGHAFTARVRPAANMDEEAAILAAGADAASKQIRNHTNLLMEYCRRLVKDIRVVGPKEKSEDVDPITGSELATSIDADLRSDPDYCWQLYVWLGAADLAGLAGRKELGEAVRGKRTGS